MIYVYGIKKEPGKPPKEDSLPADILALEGYVGGIIEIDQIAAIAQYPQQQIATSYLVLCDKDAKENGKPFCARINNRDYYGNIFIVRGTYFYNARLADVKALFPSLWEEGETNNE